MKKLSLVLVLIIALLGSTGCKEKDVMPERYDVQDTVNSKNEEKYIYESNAYISFIEPGGNDSLYNKLGYSIHYGDNTYLFSNDILEGDRNIFVKKQKEIINFLQKEGIRVEGYTFYVVTDYQNRVNDDIKTAYYDISSKGFLSQILTTLQLIYGQYINYGLIYSMSCAIGEHLGWENDNINVTEEKHKDMISFMKENPLYLELVYPCFIEPYSTKEAIEYSYILAQILFDKYVESEDWYIKTPEDLSKESQMITEQFIKKHGIDYVLSERYAYSYHGSVFPLGIITEYANIRVHAEYKENFSEYFPNHSMKTYPDIVLLLDEITEDIRIGREMLNYRDTKKVNIDFVNKKDFPKHGNEEAAGLYNHNNKKIYVSTVGAVLHEYMHYVYYMISSDNCRWATETLSEYIETYSYIQTKYIEPLGTSIWEKKYKEYIVDTKSLASDDIKKAEKRHKEQQLSIIEKTFKYHTWDLEAWNIKDIRMFILTKAHLYSYENESWKKSFDSIDYTVLFSFGNYLEQNYGYDNFLRIMLSKEDLKNITEKTEEELRNDWGQYLIDTYSYLYYE